MCKFTFKKIVDLLFYVVLQVKSTWLKLLAYHNLFKLSREASTQRFTDLIEISWECNIGINIKSGNQKKFVRMLIFCKNESEKKYIHMIIVYKRQFEAFFLLKTFYT